MLVELVGSTAALVDSPAELVGSDGSEADSGDLSPTLVDTEAGSAGSYWSISRCEALVAGLVGTLFALPPEML